MPDDFSERVAEHAQRRLQQRDLRCACFSSSDLDVGVDLDAAVAVVEDDSAWPVTVSSSSSAAARADRRLERVGCRRAARPGGAEIAELSTTRSRAPGRRRDVDLRVERVGERRDAVRRARRRATAISARLTPLARSRASAGSRAIAASNRTSCSPAPTGATTLNAYSSRPWLKNTQVADEPGPSPWRRGRRRSRGRRR